MKLTTEEIQRLQTDHEIVAPVKQEYKKIGSMILKRGMTLFAFDLKTGILEPVKIERKEAMIDINGNIVKNARAEYNPSAIYIQALNMKNAQKKLMKFFKNNENKQKQS